MQERVQRLQQKVAELAYRVESYGSHGDERQLAELRKELEKAKDKRPETPKHFGLVLVA